MDANTVWEQVRTLVGDELGWVRTQAWLEDVRLRSLDHGTAWLEVEGPRIGEKVGPDQVAALGSAFERVVGRPVQVRVSAGRRRGRRRPPTRPAKRPKAQPLELEAERVNRGNQLKTFLAGPSNELPLRFAQQAVEAPGSWHPLVFYGSSGSGKTHLVQGIVNAFRRAYPARRTVYASCARFTSQFTQALRRRQTGRFRRLYRDAALLVLDDVDTIAGKAATEQELCRTLDVLGSAGGQVVVACGASPKRIPMMAEALAGRLLGGQVVELKSPDCRTRREVVAARCAATGLELREAVVDLLTGDYELDVRELLSALTRLEAHHQVGARLDIAVAEDVVRDLVAGKRRPATIDGVCAYVCRALGVEPSHVRGRSRKPSAVQARQVAIGILRDFTSLTLREIGHHLGGRSCASVHFAQERAKELKEREPAVQALWTDAARTFERAR